MLRNALAILAALPCTVLVFAIAAVGLCLRLVSLCIRGVSRLLQPPFVPWPDLMRFDPLLGWKARPNLKAYYLADRDDVFEIETDADGWTGRASLDDCGITVIGDSFAFGYGVDTAKSFAEVDPSLRLKAVGAPGYSMVQGVLLMEELGARLKGKTVIWFVYPENDLSDGLMPNLRKYRAPFLRWNAEGERWEIERRHVNADPWECSLLAKRLGIFGQAHVPGPVSDRIYSACEYLLDRATAACRKAGATLAVMTIPHTMQLDPELKRLRDLGGNDPAFEPGLTDLRIEAQCRQLGVPFLSARDFLTLEHYKEKEGVHWNERGHRRVAEELTRFCAAIHPAEQCAERSLEEAIAEK